jgi:hypothetical protein
VRAGAAPLQVAGRISSSPPWGSQLLQEARGRAQSPTCRVAGAPRCRRGGGQTQLFVAVAEETRRSSSLLSRAQLLVADEAEAGLQPRMGHAARGGAAQTGGGRGSGCVGSGRDAEEGSHRMGL